MRRCGSCALRLPRRGHANRTFNLWGKRRVERRGEHLHAYRADEHRIIDASAPSRGQPPARKFDVFVS